nr:MAG TPA: hypothetical protein [Caudoviricetes sp.]
MQNNIYLEQFEPHAAEFAHKTHNKMKAKELDYIFEELIASLCENRNPVVKPITVYANAHYVWCADHWEKVGETDVT